MVEIDIDKYTYRIEWSQEMHRNLAIRSAEEGVSINQYIVSKL